MSLYEMLWSRTVAHAVNSRLPTAVARVRASWSGHVGFVVDKAALGQVFCKYSSTLIIHNPELVQ
jgi:hypothetical protein